MLAQTPEPPYYAVIFTSVRTDVNDNYSEMADYMLQLAQKQEGFLGAESARNEVGITVSYWKDLESIKNWKNHAEHIKAREKGRSTWYSSYKTRISRVEMDYGFEK